MEIGDDGAGFAFDSERPRHKVWLAPHALADRTVTNAEWLGFIADGGYASPLLWLSDGWGWVQAERVEAPLYWVRGDDGWSRFGLDGLAPLDLAEPACHISYYEADAYARWAGARLPTEAEWKAPRRGLILHPAISSTPPARCGPPPPTPASSAMSGSGPAAPSSLSGLRSGTGRGRRI